MLDVHEEGYEDQPPGRGAPRLADQTPFDLSPRQEQKILLAELSDLERRQYGPAASRFFLARNGRGNRPGPYSLTDAELSQRRIAGRQRFQQATPEERIEHLLTLIEIDIRSRINARRDTPSLPRLSEAGQLALLESERAGFIERTGLEPEEFLERWRQGQYEDTADNMSLLVQASALAHGRERVERPGE
jgi:hypothetical protein